MNTNPIRLIVTCEVLTTDDETLNSSVGIDVNYDATANDIHNEVLRVTGELLCEAGFSVETVVVMNICNLGQIPVPEVKEFTRSHTLGLLPGTRECRVCGDDHGSSGLPCPKMTPYA